MSQQSETLTPIKSKNSLKNLKMQLFINNPLNEEELPKLTIPNVRRRKSEIIRNSLKFNIKTEEDKEKDQKMKTRLFRQSAPYNVCIEALQIHPIYRSEQQIKIISYYLQMLKNFMNIFKDQIQNEELEEFLYNFSSLLNYEHFPKNHFIFKFGEKAEKFYIILKGKVEFCVPKVNKIFMNEEEYILFLVKLRFNDENELIKKNMENNKISFNFGESFDQFVLKTLNKHENEKENIYSDEIYLCFKKIRELLIEKKNKNDNKEIITMEEYLKRSSFTEIKSQSINKAENKRKQLNIYQFEKTNTYEDGDCFGLSSSKSKGHKRSTTAISLENCDLAILDKKTYDQLLNKITKKAKEKLYLLVMSHKIFNPISKANFNHKYSHMFRFTRFYIHNDIMDESTIFDKIIIFTSGEFILSANKNIFELNELIAKIKKLRGNLCNYSEKMIKNDINEIEENEDLLNTKKYASHSINDYMTKRQNLVISTVNDKMLLGYPDTVDQETFMPFFNCQCLSINATGYVVEKEMIKLFKRDGYLKESPPKIVIQKIEFYLKRLLEHKKNIMNRIEFLQEQDKKFGIKSFQENSNKGNKYENNNININGEKDNKKQNLPNIDNNNNINNNKSISYIKDNDKNKESEEKNDELELLNITRNNLNPINLKNNNIFPFQSKLVNQIDPIYLSNKQKNINKSRQKLLLEARKGKENFLKSIRKYEDQIKQKKYLLKITQQKSPKFILKEKTLEKQFQLYFNQYDTKGNYNDISNLFSKDPDKKSSILDKYRKKSEDNVLDPKIYLLKRQINYEKLNPILPRTNKTTEISTLINTKNNTNISLDVRDKYIMTSPKNETINNISNINNKIKLRNKNLIKDFPQSYDFINKSENKNIKIKYNNLSLDVDKISDDININKMNKSKFKNLYEELFTDYINNKLCEENKMKKVQSPSQNYQKLDNYKLNKIQLKKIKNKIIPSEKGSNNISKDSKEISIVDPLYLEKLGDKYNK